MGGNKSYQKAKVLANIKIATGIFELTISTEIAKDVQPGQFVTLGSLVSNKILSRPFSVYDNDDGHVHLIYQVVGPNTNTEAYSKLRTQDSINIFGPLGRPVVIDNQIENLILVSGGCGLASLYPLARQAVQREMSVSVMAGFRNKGSVFGINDFKGLAENVSVRVATDDGSEEFQGNSASLFTNILVDSSITPLDVTKTAVFTCGPWPMMKKVAEIARQAEISCYVFLEERMACGIGGCKGCAIKTKNGVKHICKDGPCFKAEEIDFEEVGQDERY